MFPQVVPKEPWMLENEEEDMSDAEKGKLLVSTDAILRAFVGR